jgi:hypothetical protein
VGSVREITYTSKCPRPRNAYRCDDELVVLPGASFPDIGVRCGKPAWSNTINKVYYDLGEWWFLLPSLFDFVAYAVRKEYVFSFPFCSSCPSASFRIEKRRLDDYLGAFSGAHESLLDSLSLMPPEADAEKNRSWFKRRFRWILG